MFIYFWERETEWKWWRGRERERERHRIWSRLQALSCQHRAWCGAQTHKLWGHDLSRSPALSSLNHPGTLIIYFLRERETEREQGRVREREGDTASEADSRLWAVSTEPDVELELMNREIMTWAKVGHLTDWATQAPPHPSLLLYLHRFCWICIPTLQLFIGFFFLLS